jgi:hypothetical protein
VAESALDRLFSLLGRERAGFSLPRAEEAGYSIPTRYPVIDAALARPLALPSLGERVGARLDAARDAAAVWEALRGLSPAGEASAVTADAPPLAPDPRLPSTLPSPSALLSSERGRALLAHLPKRFAAALASLCTAAEAADAEAARWLPLPPAPPPGESRPRRAAEEFFVDRFGGGYRFRTHPVGVQLEFLRDSVGLDFAVAHESVGRLLAAIQAAIPELLASTKELPRSAGALLSVETSLGPLVVGGLGPDTHVGDAFLLVDPGGDDVWNNNAGGNAGLRSRVALALDLAGNDRYGAERTHSQGAGHRGIGILVDVGIGNDEYLASRHAQGAGFQGIGVLWDQGGDDTYQAEAFGQGAGTLGVGLLLDGGGHDRAAIRARGQGFGATGGLGAHVDLAGDDQRRLGLPGEPPDSEAAGGGQGCGWGTRPFPWNDDVSLHGGVGLLYDREGDDSYYARAMGQGSAYFLALGLLLDRKGDDRYAAELASQGAAQHLAAGLLLDGDGDDSYSGSGLVLGAAEDRAVGIAVDRGRGKDSWSMEIVGSALPRDLGRGLGYARQDRAMGLAVDEGGDDLWRGGPDSLGFVLPPERPGREAMGAVLDLGGKDAWLLAPPRAGANPADGALWMQEGLAAGMDTEAEAGWDGEVAPNPAAPLAGFSWDGRSEPLPPPPDGPGDDSTDSSWASLDQFWQEQAAGKSELMTCDYGPIRELATRDERPAVRRAAARALIGGFQLDGVDVLVDSLVHRSEDNPGSGGWGTLPAFLHLLTGLDFGHDAEAWRKGWRDAKADAGTAVLDRVAERIPALFALERAASAAAGGDTRAAEESGRAAVAALPQDEAVRARAAAILGGLARWLGHPESHRHFDPKRAVELAQLAATWEPDRPQRFVDLARALHGIGEDGLARSALQKALLVDPDFGAAQALEREMQEGN